MSSRSSYSWSSRLSPASDRSCFQTVLLQWVPGAETPRLVRTPGVLGGWRFPAQRSHASSRRARSPRARAQAPSVPGFPSCWGRVHASLAPAYLWGFPFLETLSHLVGRAGVEASPGCSKQFTAS